MALQHRGSATRAEIAAQNEAFTDGVCHAIDALRALGFYEAEEALLKTLFRKAGAPAGAKAEGKADAP